MNINHRSNPLFLCWSLEWQNQCKANATISHC